VNAEFSDELALCPTVSLAEGMDGVHLAKVLSAPAGEAFKTGACEMAFALQFSARLVEARNNVLRECEGVTGFSARRMVKHSASN